MAIEHGVNEVIEGARMEYMQQTTPAKESAIAPLAAQIELAFTSASTQGYAAVKAALAASAVDGPKTERDAAMTQLKGDMRKDWAGVLGASSE